MANLTPLRRLLKVFHPEGIPGPGARVYNAISSVDIFQRAYELIAKDIAVHCAVGKLLDIGTGPGRLLIKLRDACPGMALVGMDVSPAMVDQARNNLAAAGLADQIEIRECSVSQMPFESGLFDIVVSTGSVHHWKDPARGLNEIHRVLKPGGYALIYDLVSDTPRSVLAEVGREAGRLKILLFWLHSFEEPFYGQAAYEALARSTLFGEGTVSYVSIMCCLSMRKRES